MAKKKSGKPRKGKGEDEPKLIETDHEEDKALIAAARDYVKKRNTRMAALEPELQARTKVEDLMKAKGFDEYKHGKMMIEIVHDDKVKVKIADDDTSE